MFRKSLAANVCHARSASAASASTSAMLNSSFSRPFHSSPSYHESARKQASRLKKARHQTARVEKARVAKDSKPHPALGYAAGNESIWTSSKLYRLIVTEDHVQRLKTPEAVIEMEPEIKVTDEGRKSVYNIEEGKEETEFTGRTVPKLVAGRPVVTHHTTPELLNYGVGEPERELLFQALPEARTTRKMIEEQYGKLEDMAKQKLRSSSEDQWASLLEGSLGDKHDKSKELEINANASSVDARPEESTKYWFGRLLDLKNADASGLEFFNKHRIVEAFSTQGKPHDPGLPEVQAALKTYRIHTLWDHLTRHRRDIHNRRQLMLMIHERAKILLYLRQKYRARYEGVLPELGLERGAVEGPLELPKTIWSS